MFETIESACNERGAHLHIPDEKNMQVNGTALTGTALTWRGLPLTLPFTGAHQVHNAATALTVLDVLREKHANITDEALQKGFASRRAWRFYPKSRSCF